MGLNQRNSTDPLEGRNHRNSSSSPEGLNQRNSTDRLERIESLEQYWFSGGVTSI